MRGGSRSGRRDTFPAAALPSCLSLLGATPLLPLVCAPCRIRQGVQRPLAGRHRGGQSGGAPGGGRGGGHAVEGAPAQVRRAGPAANRTPGRDRAPDSTSPCAAAACLPSPQHERVPPQLHHHLQGATACCVCSAHTPTLPSLLMVKTLGMTGIPDARVWCVMTCDDLYSCRW